jgi:ribonuclease J
VSPVGEPVRIVPLGGLGEVGMNCLAVEAAGRIAVIDCGVLFTDEPFGVDVMIPDLSWLVERRAQVDAIFLTHGHEDHVGALPFLLRQVPAPVYGTRFTLAMVEGRLREAGVAADLREVRPGESWPAGAASPLRAEFIAVTHSIPDACALSLTTPQGMIIHSGDFKIDERPVRGPGMDLARLEALGDAGVRLLLSDSTNAERPGWARSESAVGPGLQDVMGEATGRVFVATFSSNAHRLQQVVEAAAASGRRLALLGRGMVENFDIARVLGQLTEPGWMPVTADEARRLPPRELAVLTTGSQGEPRAALGRLARGEHKELAVHAGDTVVLSSRQIPGNELAVGRLVNALSARGALVRWDGHPPLHATGHAQEGEQRRLLQLTRPERFMPVHGEYRQLARHAAHAAAEGVPPARCHLLTDGQVLELDDAGARVLPARVRSGRVAIARDEGGAAEVPDAVIEDRRRLAEFGLCVVVVQVDAGSGAVVGGPEFHARGVAGLTGREAELGAEVLAALHGSAAARGEARLEVLRLSVRRWFRRATGRRPLVEPVVVER